MWEELERAVQRGRGEELLRSGPSFHYILSTTSLLREGDRSTLLRRPEYTRSGRSIDFAGKLRLCLVHLAVLERKPLILALLLRDLDTEQLTATVRAQLVVLEQERILPSRKDDDETKRMFTVAGKKGANSSVISCMETKVDWRSTYQWSTVHLAVKHDVECLKVLLHLVEQRLQPEQLSDLLNWRDSKGRTALHLAAADPTSSTPTKVRTVSS